MTIGTYDIDRAFTTHARELDALDRTVSKLRYSLDELSEDQDTLKQRVSMLETDSIEPLRFSITDLEEAAEELQGDWRRPGPSSIIWPDDLPGSNTTYGPALV